MDATIQLQAPDKIFDFLFSQMYTHTAGQLDHRLHHIVGTKFGVLRPTLDALSLKLSATDKERYLA